MFKKRKIFGKKSENCSKIKNFAHRKKLFGQKK